MNQYFDALETRSADERMAAQLDAVNRQIAAHGMDPLSDLSELVKLPVLRKADLSARQKVAPPFGNLPVANVAHYFQSPGPIYEPGGAGVDWFRFGRALYAAGVRKEDIVQNCFSYHLTPAGTMFESGARAIGCAVLPAGTGQTALQAQAAHDIGITTYAGTPDYLKLILDKADEMGLALKIDKAVVGAGALFPSLRQEYNDRGITCLQGYGTADLGSVAYETPALEGMVVDEGVIVEIVTPGTGDPVAEGEVGELLVTTLNPDYPLLRFATGDLSAVLPGQSPCGRTNMRIKGWMGRADQTTKIKGMFVRPEQVAALVARHAEIGKARVIAGRKNEMDTMVVRVEADGGDAGAYAKSVAELLKLKGEVEVVAPGTLPRDGLVIEDTRSYD